MSSLAPNLFQRRFQDLVEIGRARLPSVAPEWTDHNAHDPGITLMELLAWVAEAQLYSLSRQRRDERAAYAALLGIADHGTQGVTGLIWSDPQDPNSPAATYKRGLVLAAETQINVTDGESSKFRPTQRLLWAPGSLTKLETRGASGRTTDHTITNKRGGLPFFPFGERGGRRNVLTLTFECRDEAGIFGRDRESAKQAFWPIGIRLAPPVGGAAAPAKSGESDWSPLAATLVTDDERTRLRIVSDTTSGFLKSGAVLLDLDSVKSSPGQFRIELRSAGGFSLPPRALRIEPNVIPVMQSVMTTDQQQEANGLPDWSFKLENEGLSFDADKEPITVTVGKASGSQEIWQRCERLSDHGPDDNVYELDLNTREITFGNSINGRIPPAGSPVIASYSVSDGEEGRVARNRTWKVTGFDRPFGINPDPIAGGLAASGTIDDRREARRRSREDHALVSANDIAAAAQALPLLEVARAWVPAPPKGAPRTGVVTLIAMRSRPGGNEPAQPPETNQWLQAIRRALSPRMPLGSRLIVAAPRYVEFSIQAQVEADPGRKPSAVKEAVEKELKKRLALVAGPGVTPRQPGVPVSRRDVESWIRAVDGVNGLVLKLYQSNAESPKIKVPRNGLPRWVAGSGNSIEVKRPAPGRSR